MECIPIFRARFPNSILGKINQIIVLSLFVEYIRNRILDSITQNEIVITYHQIYENFVILYKIFAKLFSTRV